MTTQTDLPRLEQVGPSPSGSSLPSFRRLPILCIATAFTALELCVSARYGFHRDELYFLACARHLAWGYVDQPPLVPAVAWLSTHVAGTSPEAIRFLPALAGGGAVVLTALMARELGGAARAQTLAALAAATSPQLLAMFHLLSTAAFDTFFWCATTFVMLRFLRTGHGWLLLIVGGLVGVGLLNKWNIALLALGLVFGVLIGGRARILQSPWAWGGALAALLIWSPDLIWNAQHHWAEVAMTRSLHQENAGFGADLQFIPSQFVVVGPVLIVFWVAGLRRLLTSPLARPLGVTYLMLVGLFTLSGGKPYYLAGMYYVLFAAGGVWAEARLVRHHPPKGLRGWATLMVVGALVSLLLVLPVLPESSLPRGNWEGDINKDLSATVGWQHFVRQIAGIASTLPPAQRSDVVVFTGDYGAASAIDLWGSAFGLPHAISGHNNYWWWGPQAARNGATTIAVNLSAGYLHTIFSHVTYAGSVTSPNGVWTEERGDPIWICTGQRTSWAQAWPAARHYG